MCENVSSSSETSLPIWGWEDEKKNGRRIIIKIFTGSFLRYFENCYGLDEVETKIVACLVADVKMLLESLKFIFGNVFPLFAFWLLLHFGYNRYGYGLQRFNGPFLASISSLWRVWDVWRAKDAIPFYYLHKRYGRIVRLGPRKLSFQDPSAIRDIYGPNGLTQKSDMHLVAQQTSRGEAFQTLFATTDTAWHNDLRRKINQAFSMTTMVQYERYVDEAIDALINAFVVRFADKKDPEGMVDLPKWLHYFTEDAVTNVTYGRRMGYLEREDYLGLQARVTGLLAYASVVMHCPPLDRLLRKNELLMWLNRHGWLNRPAAETVPFAMRAQEERKKLLAEQPYEGKNPDETLTDIFLKAQREHPDVVGPREVLALGLSLLAAGSDSTAATLSAVFYYVLKNPTCYAKLVSEIDRAFPPGTSIPFVQAQKLPYLSAVVKETFRMHPASSWAPERVVGPGGHIIAGEYVPGGTIVSVSAWVVHRDPGIFGDDVFKFRPERWLAEDTPDERARVRRMESNLLQFGVGNFNCIGKNVALMETYKVVPALLRRFQFRLSEPEKEWKFNLPQSFVTVRDFEVLLQARDVKS